MIKQQLYDLLGRITGHLVAGSPQQETELERLQHFLSRSLLPEEPQQLKGSNFSFENADLFSTENIPAAHLEALRSLTEKRADDFEPEFRVFVREVPVRSTQLHASIPLWAGGAAVEQTIGPFTNKDGRQFWFDFFTIEKLVALYVQGRPAPFLLFKTTIRHRFIDIFLPLAADLASSYDLPAGSIWINSAIFAPNAPAGYYTGLNIKGGTITLSASPQMINGKLTVSANTVVTVKLALQQPSVKDADASSPYGVDARDAEIELPEKLSFHFSGSGSVLDKIAPARWNVYGHEASFSRNNQPQAAVYDSVLHRVLISLTCSEDVFEAADCRSPFYQIRGRARIARSAWALPAAPIDILHPTPAAGIGALLVICRKGLTNAWKNLTGGELNLNQPYVMAEPGRISLTDLSAGNMFCQQTFNLWKDQQNHFGTSVELLYPQATPFFYNTFANGNETLAVLTNADVKIDRPVTVAGQALAVRSKNSLLILAVSSQFRLIYLFDDNILFDNLDLSTKVPAFPNPIALAMRNALFKVTPANGCLLFGALTEDFVRVDRGFLYLTFGLYAYLPTLPDPYAANVRNLRFQFRESRDNPRFAVSNMQSISLWLVCLVNWHLTDTPEDLVKVSFHFAPLQNQFQLSETASASTSNSDSSLSRISNTFNDPIFTQCARNATTNRESPTTNLAETTRLDAFTGGHGLPDYGGRWDGSLGILQQECFALLDVSTNADLLGISFSNLDDRLLALITTHIAAPVPTPTKPGLAIQVQGMDVVSRGSNVRAFTVPQISWEPVINLTKPQRAGDPLEGFNYYPNDGGPTRLLNFSDQQVALAPIPLTNFLVDTFARDDRFAAMALFTLPFGLKALAVLQNKYDFEGVSRRGTRLRYNSKSFENNLAGARQLEVEAGQALVEGESDTFKGSTIQVNNILEMDGTAKGNSTLGASVTEIFNNEFLLDPPEFFRQRGVPLTRMDLSGYGASIFSNWLNPKATIAATSQAKFDVFVGRCAHEVIQVKSIVHPWLFRVVRTITLFRTASGYAFRYDSGWQPESNGKFDLRYYVNVRNPGDGLLKPQAKLGPYEIHPGIVYGLFNIKEIKETEEIKPFTGQMVVKGAVYSGTTKTKNGDLYVDINGEEKENESTTDMVFDVELQPVYFNSDVEIENPVNGFSTRTIEGREGKVVPSRRILGFVQILPRGMPISQVTLRDLIGRQGTIGGPIDCVVNIGGSGQKMRLNRFDMSNSFGTNGSDPVFVAAGRGNVILPRDGSWSMVKHEQGTGEVSPVPEDLSVPLIRIGNLVKQINPVTLETELIVKPDPAGELLRIANPTELLRPPVKETLNYGFLQSTDTQKALFLTPSFALGLDKLLSKTPPLFADAFRIVNSKSIFPNIGDAVSDFGEVISLVKSGSEFTENALTDGGKKVLELMQIDKVLGGVREEGYQLLKKVTEFDLPTTEWKLIDIGGAFKIYIEYKNDNVKTPGGGTKNKTGKLDFDVNSFAGNLADTWKSRMKNVALVVDLGPISRLMTIKGNWDSQKGTEAQYKGDASDPDFPSPQIEFAPALQPVIDILEILQDLQGENYKGAFQKGLKLAMSNKAGSWEYKFEAAKEIPVVRFPMPNEVYNQPTVPLKLEAGLKLGAYFNAALKVTTDPKQLLPTAGGFLEFYGRLSVMCVSLAAATVYAVGQVDLKIAADTKVGPSLTMKFGFGAQIVVGLPVVGNVSVLYMVGIEIYIASGVVAVTASMLFQGHAELLGGLVGVTITIEAKGTVTRTESPKRTDLAAQVTFGIDISIFLVIDISFSTSWQESRQIA